MVLLGHGARLRVMALIPARDSEATVGEVVRGLQRALPEATVLVVDDGSADETSGAARAAGADVIRHEVNRGKGAALQTGFDEAVRRGAERVITLDADRQHDPSRAPQLLLALEGADIVIGSRDRDRTGMPWIRRATNSVMTWIVSHLARHRIPDTQSGFRAVRSSVFTAVRPGSQRFEYESEFLIEAGRKGFTFGSVAIPTLYNAPGSHIRPFRDTLRFIRLLFRRWND